MKDVKKMLAEEIKNKGMFLISLSSKDYREGMKGITEFASERFEKVCYITINDPSASIKSAFVQETSSKLFFIDCVTSTVKTPKDMNGVIFVSSPKALTEISIATKKAIDSGMADSIILDSISAMLVYEKSLNVMKFIHNQVLTFREADIPALFVILREDVSSELMKDLTMFVDRIIEAD